MNFGRRSAFTLAEMMVVMLILSIVTAASLPIITKRSHSTDSVWQWASNGTDSYFGQAETQGAIIGSTSFGSSASSKLLLNTGSLGQNHILFKQGEVETGHLVVDNSANVGLGKIDLGVAPPTSPTVTGATAIGYGAKANNTSATALGSNTEATGAYSLATGTEAYATAERAISSGYDINADGSYSIAIGSETRAVMTNGIAIGCRTGASKEESISIGYNSGANGTGSVVVGAESWATGDYSTALGYKTYAAGAKGTAIGTGNSSYGAIAEEGIAIGYLAIANGSSPGVAIGSGANSNTGGVAIGAASNSKNGSVAVGPGARAGTTEDTAVGYLALASKDLTSLNTNNTAICYNTLAKSANSYWNTAVGSLALYNNNYSGHNVAVGYKSSYSNLNGDSNTSVGTNALSNNSGGDYNTAIGENACSGVTGSNKICIGYGSGPSGGSTYATDSNERVFIGGTSKYNGETAVLEVHNLTTSNSLTANITNYSNNNTGVVINGNLLVKGRIYVRTKYSDSNSIRDDIINYESGNGRPHFEAGNNGGNELWSDRRLKNVGKPFDSSLNKINKLNVYNYTYKNDKSKKPRVGVIAQDLEKIFPNAISKDSEGYRMIRTDDIFYTMLNSIKELDKITRNINSKINAILSSINRINDKIIAMMNVDQINSQKIKMLEAKNKALEYRLAKLEKLAQK